MGRRRRNNNVTMCVTQMWNETEIIQSDIRSCIRLDDIKQIAKWCCPYADDADSLIRRCMNAAAAKVKSTLIETYIEFYYYYNSPFTCSMFHVPSSVQCVKHEYEYSIFSVVLEPLPLQMSFSHSIRLR